MKITRKMKIAAVALGALGIVAGVAVAANASTRPATGRENSNYHLCVGPDKTVHVNPTLNDATCPPGQIGFTIGSGIKGDPGTPGTPGTNGTNGAPGTPGTNGTNGTNGVDGTDGVDAQALPYGVGLVRVLRGAGSFSTWQTLSTTVGSPVGDTASGTFRFTCSTANAPCKVELKAYATVTGVSVYPRIDIMRQDYNTGGPQTYCEYADGSDNSNATTALGTDASGTSVPLGVGGSLDCNPPTQTIGTGVVNFVEVPAGYYDVTTTLAFKK